MQHVARFAVWPCVVGLSTVGFALAFASGQALLSLALVPAVAWIVIVACELWIPAVPWADALRDPQARQDIFHTVVGQGLGNQLGATLVAGALALPLGWAGGRFGFALWPADWPLAVQVLLGVFLADGIEYARHRAEHGWSWLWPVHALHHSVDRMNVLKSGRGHFLDMVLRHLMVFLPLAVIGTPTGILLAYAAAVTVLGPIGHSNVDMRIPAFLHRVVMTPQVHRIHHARAPELAFSNYANVFPIWDVLFGTFQDPTRVEPDAFGVENDSMPASLWGQIAAPFACAWRRMLDGDAARTKALEASERSLEAKVADRTAELSVARDEALAASRAKSTFLANMSHELRTPLTAIIGYGELLHEAAERQGSERLAADLGGILSAGHQLLGLVDEVLDLSRIEAGRLSLALERFEIEPLVAEAAATVKPLLDHNGNRLELALAPALGSMRSDPTKLRQILVNLLGNAAKFTSGGTVRLAVQRTDEGGAPWLELRVADSGIGMTREQLGRVFETFTQADPSIFAKYGGTGLGLTIVRRFCELLGGEVRVESEPGRGSEFLVRLPAELLEPRAGVEPGEAGA